MTRLPGCALQVRGRAPGFFDRTSVSCRKTGRIPAATLRAFLHPPAASYGDPGGPEPKQEPNSPGVAGRLFVCCRSALCARTPPAGRPVRPRSRTRCAPTRERAGLWMADQRRRSVFLWERTLCATSLRSGTPQRGCRAQGALPQTSHKPARQRGLAKADAQRGSALSPQRHGALRSALNSPLCSGGGCQATTCLKRSGLSQGNAASS
jgi:hypothetical protein